MLLIFSLPCVTGSREVFKLVIGAPEDINLKRDITVEVIEIDQTIATVSLTPSLQQYQDYLQQSSSLPIVA